MIRADSFCRAVLSLVAGWAIFGQSFAHAAPPAAKPGPFSGEHVSVPAFKDGRGRVTPEVRYELREKLGAGWSNEVYRAVRRSPAKGPPRVVAVKVPVQREGMVPGEEGRRTIDADDLYVGPLETSLHHDEVAVSAWFPALAEGAGVAFEEIARRHGDYALCGVAAVVDGDRVRAGFLSVCEVPTVVDLTGVDEADLGDAALEHLEPGDDIHATADYRAHLVRVLTRRVVATARESAA